MNAPQITFIVLVALSLGIAIANHGKPRSDKYSFPMVLLSACIELGVLYWGGFFSGAA